MEDLITHAATLFQPSNPSPPLPPAPLGEVPHTVSYGSAHTKVGKVTALARSPSPRSQDPYVIRTAASEGRHRKAPSDDFAPQLPSNPANSIHPSLRSGPMSAVPSRQSLPPALRSAQYYEEHIPYAQYANAPQSATLPLPPGAAPPSPQKRELALHPSSPLVSPWSDDAITPTPSSRSISQDSRTPPSSTEGTLVQAEDPVKRTTSNGTVGSPTRKQQEQPAPAPSTSSSSRSERITPSPTKPLPPLQTDSPPASVTPLDPVIPDPAVEPPTPPKSSSPLPPSPSATSEGTTGSYVTVDVEARRNSIDSVE